MRARNEKTLDAVEAAPRVEESKLEKLPAHFITASDAIAILRQAQAVTAGMAAAADRVSAEIARAVSP